MAQSTAPSQPQSPRPTIGRIVIFHAAEGERAALVSHVYADGSLSLHVMSMPQDTAGCDAVVAWHGVTEGPSTGQWSWPQVQR